AEVFDPATSEFSPVTNQLPTAASGVAAALLPSGEVLVVGGTNGVSVGSLTQAQLYDPALNQFLASKQQLNVARNQPSATTLNDGTVLVAGGAASDGSSIASAEIYDPSTQSFSFAANQMTQARSGPTAVLLKNGQVLLAGGGGGLGNPSLASAEIYDPV